LNLRQRTPVCGRAAARGSGAAAVAAQWRRRTRAVAVGWDLLAVREFVNFINMHPDHDFNAAPLRGEIEKRAA
jgi:hypothetical protein